MKSSNFEMATARRSTGNMKTFLLVLALGVYETYAASCAAGKWGGSCEYECHCPGNAACNVADGSCKDNKCATGWSDKSCSVGNSAAGKTAKQSSTYGKWDAGKAVDMKMIGGKLGNGVWDNVCAHTKQDDGPWWEVDLKSTHVIYSVSILNRDQSFGRLKDFTIRVGDNEDFSKNPICAIQTAMVYDGKTLNAPCQTTPTAGRYVSISVNKKRKDYLTLCEVELPKSYKRAATCPSGKFGPNCQWDCHCTDKDEQASCFKHNGRCPKHGCSEGYGGNDCRSPCKKGYFGLNCASKCHCVGLKCDPLKGTGECKKPATCMPGWSGPTCALGNLLLDGAKRCAQSSLLYSNSPKIGDCKLAYDNNTESEFSKGSCQHTNNDPSPWWKVDLGSKAAVRNVAIKNRKLYGNRLNNLEIRVGTDWDTWENNRVCNARVAPVENDKLVVFNCLETITGNVIWIKKSVLGYLTMCEVIINGFYYEKACPPGFYGAGCKTKCGQCVNNEACDPVNGFCKNGCKQGYRNNRCDDEAPKCPDSWKLLYSTWTGCYKRIEGKELTQKEALAECKKLDAKKSHLLSVETKKESDAIYQWLKNNNDAKDLITSGTCVNGKSCVWLEPYRHPFEIYEWAQGQPDESGPVLQLWKAAQYGWDDVVVDRKGTILCEWYPDGK